jgi:phage protein D
MPHYATSSVILKVGGSPVPEKVQEDIIQVVVEESIDLPGMFTIVINNDYYPGRSQDQPWAGSLEDLFSVGKKVEIGFSTSTTANFSEGAEDSSLFEGEITAVETQFTSGSQAPLVVRGYDASHRLHRGRFNRSFLNVTDSDVVKKIAGEVGIPLGKVEDSGVVHEYIFQQNQTNMEFLRSRAARIGFELFVQNGKLNFRKPAADEEVEATWLGDMANFRTRASGSDQVSEVEVRGWDYKEKKPIVATANKESGVVTKNQQGAGSEAAGKLKGGKKLVVVGQPVYTQQEADKMAQSIMDEMGGQFIQADGEGQGNPQIRAGKKIKLSNISKSSSGPQSTMGKSDGGYYVNSCRHLYNKRDYTTSFSVRGSRGGSMLGAIGNAGASRNPGEGFVVGIVTENKDPNNMSRIKVKMPTLTEEHTSFWARMVSLGAGAGRGFDCLPEINDEVLIGFEHGDIHRPFVIGSVWNGKDAPPEKNEEAIKGTNVNLRTFKTRTGHELKFIEEDAGSHKRGCVLTTAEQHKIQINDSEKLITLETKGGHKITLNDQDGTITIDSTGDINLKAKKSISLEAGQDIKLNAKKNVDVNASGNSSMSSNGSMGMKARSVDLSGDAMVNVKGGVVKIN